MIVSKQDKHTCDHVREVGLDVFKKPIIRGKVHKMTPFITEGPKRVKNHLGGWDDAVDKDYKKITETKKGFMCPKCLKIKV